MRAPHPRLFALSRSIRIDRLSLRTSSAVQRAERYADTEEVWPGGTETALYWYRRFLARPGRYLDVASAVCPCPSDRLEDVAAARDLLEHLTVLLPEPARQEFEALLTRFDAELWRRTLPDPFAFRDPGRRGGWWHLRLRGDRPFG